MTNGMIYLMKQRGLYHISNLLYFIKRSFHKYFSDIHQISFNIKKINSIFKRKNHYRSAHRINFFSPTQHVNINLPITHHKSIIH